MSAFDFNKHGRYREQTYRLIGVLRPLRPTVRSAAIGGQFGWGGGQTGFRLEMTESRPSASVTTVQF
jgi:hypothetical protein